MGAEGAEPSYRWAEQFLRPLLDGDRAWAEDEYIDPALEVQGASGATQGRGLFLRGKAERGRVLLVERAALEGQPGGQPFLAAACADAWELCSDVDRGRWRSLGSHGEVQTAPCAPVPVAEWGQQDDESAKAAPSSEWLAGTVELNGMANVDLVENPSGLKHVGHLAGPNQDAVSLYPLGGLLNHSCYPTVEKVAFPGWLVVRAARPLCEHTELTQAYIDVRSPYLLRQQQLKDEWGFSCRCNRCSLEALFWSDPKLVGESAALWQAYLSLMNQQRGGLQAMMLLVQQMEKITDKALESALVQDMSTNEEWCKNSWLSQFQAAFQLTPKQSRVIMNGQDTGVLEDTAPVIAFKRLRNCLLASNWLAPAMQLAHGLAAVRRYDQSINLFSKIIDVLNEVLPCSSLHVESSLQRVLCAVDAGHSESDIFQMFAGAVSVTEAAYGDGCASVQILLGSRLDKHYSQAALMRKMLESVEGKLSLGLSIKADASPSLRVPTRSASSIPSEPVPGCATTRKVLKEGSGRGLVAGSLVTVHALGIVMETGRKFWSTRDSGQSLFTYTAGCGQVIPGWDHGCLGMKVGEERQLIIPAEEAYGSSGFATWDIPPGATLQFTLECIDIKHPAVHHEQPLQPSTGAHMSADVSTCILDGMD